MLEYWQFPNTPEEAWISKLSVRCKIALWHGSKRQAPDVLLTPEVVRSHGPDRYFGIPNVGRVTRQELALAVGWPVATKQRTEWHRWAILRPITGLYVHDRESDEAEAWQIALGWPSLSEILRKQSAGARAPSVW